MAKKYTGDHEKDFSATLVWMIAETVAERIVRVVDDKTAHEAKALGDYLLGRFTAIYKANTDWGKKLLKEENGSKGARDSVYKWMEYWAKHRPTDLTLIQI